MVSNTFGRRFKISLQIVRTGSSEADVSLEPLTDAINAVCVNRTLLISYECKQIIYKDSKPCNTLFTVLVSLLFLLISAFSWSPNTSGSGLKENVDIYSKLFSLVGIKGITYFPELVNLKLQGKRGLKATVVNFQNINKLKLKEIKFGARTT